MNQLKLTRKCFVFLVFCISTIASFSQSTLASQPNWDTLPYRQHADYLLQFLNKSYIPTGVLYDRVFPVANVDEFTGDINTSDTSNPSHFTRTTT